MSEAFIISAVRTPLSANLKAGSLELSALVLQEAVRRSGVNPGRLEDLIWGEDGRRMANRGRMSFLQQAASQAGFPPRLPAVAVNRASLSSHQALHFAAQVIMAGDADLLLAGGCETGPEPLAVLQSNGPETADELSGTPQKELEAYRQASLSRARQAVEEGWLDRQVAPALGKHHRRVERDECIAWPSPDQPDGPLPYRSATPVRTGAAALVLASTRAVGRLNLAPLARIAARIVLASEPVLEGMRWVAQRALQQADLSLDEVDRFEIDESCAACIPEWMRSFQVEQERVNPSGGALALGNPGSAAGAVWTVWLAHELARTHQSYGLYLAFAQGVCMATVLERV